MSVANDVLAWSMDRRKHRERVEDQESQNSFALTSMWEQGKINEEAADKASKRRIEEAKEANRLQTYHKAKQLGVEGISIDDPQAKLDDAILEKSRQINRGILEGYKAQKKANLRDIKEAESKYYAEVRKNGSPEQIRTAIMNIYNNASLTAGLSDKQKQMIRDAADPKKSTDPAAAMQKAVDAIRDTHGWTTFDSTEAKRASDIFSAFDEQRGAIVDADKKSTLPVIAEQIHSAYQSDREFNKSIVTQIPALTSILSDKERKNYMPVASKGSLFSGMTGADGVLKPPGDKDPKTPEDDVDPGAGGQNGELTVPAAGSSSFQEPPPIGTNDSLVGDVMSRLPQTAGEAFGKYRKAVEDGPIGQILGVFNPGSDVQSDVYNALFAKPNGAKPTDADIAAARAVRDRRMGKPIPIGNAPTVPPQSSAIGDKLKEMISKDAVASYQANPNQRLLPASPDELSEARRLNKVISGENDHHLDLLLNSETPSEKMFGIAALNSLIKAVRLSGSGSLPPISVPG